MSERATSAPSHDTTGLDPVVLAADEQYRARNWRTALALYSAALASGVDAAALGLPLAIGHCRIELADAAALAQLSLPTGWPTNTPREGEFAYAAYARGFDLCRAGDYERASRLMRLLAGYIWPVADCYAHCIVKGRTECCEVFDRPVDGPPPFLAEHAITDHDIARLRRRHAGARVLIVARRYYAPSSARQYEMTDNFVRSAQRFGLVASEMNSHSGEPGSSDADYPVQLEARIRATRPAVILFDELYETGVSSGAAAAGVAGVLARARRETGVRVVKTLTDAWWSHSLGPERIFRGLDDSVDLIHHCHPGILGAVPSAPNDRVFCYLQPTCLPPPSVAYGTIPGGAFIGGVTTAKQSRLVVWAESGRVGLPIDFKAGLGDGFQGQGQLDDADYARLLRQYELIVNLTRRDSGVLILVGRTIETMLCGGVLLEEDSVDTAYFFKRGVHYQPFQSLDDLQELMPRLLADPARRQRMIESGQAWTQNYFTGEHFWAGLLHRLFD